MSLPRYPQYKDSEVRWLGPIPVGWNVMRLMRVASVNDDVLSESTPTTFEIEYVDIGSVSLDHGIERTEQFCFSDAPSRARRLVRDGDVLVSTVRTYLKAIAPVVQPPENLVVSTGFAVVRPTSVLDSRYAKFALQTTGFVDEVISRSTGVSYPAINASDLVRICIPVPPPSEQIVIAKFLDRETAKIDALIAEQEKLIALLAEKRQATISHAVTRGLNPDAPMKDSGVEWLGEVPEHWQVVKGSRIGILFGSGPVSEDEVHEMGSVPFVKVGSLSSEGFDIAKWNWYVSEVTAGRLNLYSEFVVFPKRGAAIFLNKVNIVRCKALIDPNLMGWKVGKDALSEYVAFLLTVRKLQELADVSTVPQINNKHIEPEKFPMPPLTEQDAIVDFLLAECSKLKLLKVEADRAIYLLKERRSALISAAVTGQIDVRNAVKLLAEEVALAV